MRLIGDYISYIKDIRRYSARTQAIYSDALKVFVEDCGAATDEELLKSLTPQIIRSHEVYLLEKREDSPRTVRLHLSVLSGNMMNQEGCREKGHLQINKIVVQSLAELHAQLLQSPKFPFYSAEYYKVLPFIVELRNRGDKDINEIETCLNALYGVMMLRLQQKEITPSTQNAIKEITTFIGMLSDYYHKDKTEGINFDED